MKKEKDYKQTIIWSALFIVIFLWVFSWYYIDNCAIPSTSENTATYLAERGAFGDKFGFINSLFSGLALTGIIISIYFQQKELSLQRNELVETREEFKDQNFQTSFFNLLKTQRQLADEISTKVWHLKTYDSFRSIELKGRLFFNQSKSELSRIIQALNSENYTDFTEWNEYMEHYESPADHMEDAALTKSRKLSYTLKYYSISKETWEKSKDLNPIKLAHLSYGIFFTKFHFAMGHYFRHLYHIFNFLEEKENERKELKEETDYIEIEKEFKTFANFVQAQMTTPELFLLFYNSLSFPKLQRLLIKYNILENLTIEDLLQKEHNCIDGINLKSRSDILK